MTINRRELKKNARAVMREAKPSPVLVYLVLSIILTVLQVLSMNLNGEISAYRDVLANAGAYIVNGQINAPALAAVLAQAEPAGATGFGWVLSTAIELITMVLSVGMTLYFLRISRGIKASFGDLFDGFGVFLKAILITILPAFLLMLWSLIYVIPAMTISIGMESMFGISTVMLVCLPLLIPTIIASCAYSQATYIMLDTPNAVCIQCIMLSKTMMRGHKWEFFKLQLSFIGWILLMVIPFVSLWVVPYMEITFAEYYKTLAADFVAKNAAPVQPEPPHDPGE